MKKAFGGGTEVIYFKTKFETRHLKKLKYKKRIKYKTDGKHLTRYGHVH